MTMAYVVAAAEKKKLVALEVLQQHVGYVPPVHLETVVEEVVPRWVIFVFGESQFHYSASWTYSSYRNRWWYHR